MLHFVSPKDLVPNLSSVLLAFSGGSDSSVLLDVLSKDAKEKNYQIYLAHLNHGIRGEEADRDEAFCQKMAEVYQCKLFKKKVDIPRIAKERKRGLEEVAREERYLFFREIMQQENISVLVTAHHANDNVETFLFRLTRGTGVHGLVSMKVKQPFDDGWLIRPFLYTEKKNIQSYALENKIDYCLDSTNEDTDYTRNYIRAKVIPKVENLNEKALEHISNTMEDLSNDDDCLMQMAKNYLENHNELLADDLLSLPISIRKRVFQLVANQRLGGSLERVHMNALEELLIMQKGMVALPKGYVATIKRKQFVIVQKEETQEEDKTFSIPFFTESCEMKSSSMILTVEKMENIPIKINRHMLCVPCDVLLDSLYWRNYQEGDSIILAGHHKKVRKIWNERKIPIEERKDIPILTDGENICFIPGVGASDKFKDLTNAKDVYFIHFKGENKNGITG